MILQQLEKDYNRILGYDTDSEGEEKEDDSEDEIDLAPPSMYEVKPVAWKIVLDENGAFHGLVRLSGGGKKDRGKMMPVPSIVRTVNISPLLFADTPAYVLGLELEDKKAELKHQAFRELVAKYAESSQTSWLKAINSFYGNDIEVAKQAALESGIGKSDTITFEVGNIWPVDQADVREFWAALCGQSAKKSEPMQCLVCGQERPAVESMPFLIKGVPGGQTSGTALVSINLNVFESYGLKRATTSPICAECAERFNKALKALMKSRRTHQRIGNLVYVFWTVEEAQGAIDLLNRPEPEMVRELLTSPQDGKWRDVESQAFYALALSANAARIVVRNWLASTVGEVRRNLAQWFRWQQTMGEYGEVGRPLAIWMLAGCMYRPKANGGLATEDVEKRLSEALYQSALQGAPLPIDILYRAVLRNRVENHVTYERAALILAVLRSRNEIHESFMMEAEEPMTDQRTELDQNDDKRAQICGKLLAVLEELQNLFALVDNRKLNATLVDRCFGAASSAPATVFGTLLTDAQAHLTKLRKARPGTYDALQIQLENILSDLDKFPPTLTLKQQALFSLGYYKKRAEIRRGKIEGAIAKRAKEGESTETSSSNSETTKEKEN